MSCTLCANPVTGTPVLLHGRSFHLCAQCDLLFLDPSQHLSPEEEKARYEQHNNDVNDPRYQDFVRPVFDEIRAIAPLGADGLDFGAGTGPVLAKMLEEAGYRVQKYDPFFWPDPQTLNFKYDFICATEVVEHFANPAREFPKLRKLLNPQAPLAIMTLMRDPETDLASWYYLRDPTHVCAYSRRTFEWIAANFGFTAVSFKSDRVIVLT